MRRVSVVGVSGAGKTWLGRRLAAAMGVEHIELDAIFHRNGNREPITGMFRRDPRENIVLWSWTNHDKYARRYAAAAVDPANAHLDFVRVSSNGDAERLLATAFHHHRSP